VKSPRRAFTCDKNHLSLGIPSTEYADRYKLKFAPSNITIRLSSYFKSKRSTDLQKGTSRS
jgi:hypothetical protein